MTTATALIAEDEPLLARHLASQLAQLWPALRLLAVVDNGLDAAAQALALRPQVCFLDIRMPGQSGLEAAQAIVEDWPAAQALPLLVFVTAYDQYAVQAFEAQAADYLLKPVTDVRLAACVQRLQGRLQPASAETVHAPSQALLAQLRALLSAQPDLPAPAANPPTHPPTRLSVIQASSGNLVHMVPVDKVLYLEAADKYIRVLTAEHEYLIRVPLRELLPQLDPQQFWQVHRGLVVRATAIATAQRDDSGKVFLKLHGRPERLTASRLYAHLFKGM